MEQRLDIYKRKDIYVKEQARMAKSAISEANKAFELLMEISPRTQAYWRNLRNSKGMLSRRKTRRKRPFRPWRERWTRYLWWTCFTRYTRRQASPRLVGFLFPLYYPYIIALWRCGLTSSRSDLEEGKYSKLYPTHILTKTAMAVLVRIWVKEKF